MLKPILVAAVLMAAAAPALAQTDSSAPPRSPPSPEAREAMRKACAADIKTYCADAVGERGKMGQCLRQNFDKLSPDCQTQLKAMRSQRPQG